MINEGIQKKFFLIIFLVVTVFVIFNFKVFFQSENVEVEGFKNNNFLVTDKDSFFLKGKAPGSIKLLINNIGLLA